MRIFKILSLSIVISATVFSCRQNDQDGESLPEVTAKGNIMGRTMAEDSISAIKKDSVATIQSLDEPDTDPHIPPKK